MKVDVSQLKKEIDVACEKWDYSGAYVIAKGEELLHRGLYGFADRDNNVPTNEDTKYVLHAISSFFVGIGIAILVDQGNLKFEDKLSMWLPEYQHADKITILNLLQNASGIPDYFYNKIMLDLNSDETHLKLSDYDKIRVETQFFYQNRTFNKVMALIGEMPLEYSPGTLDKGDSESDAVFLAEVIERITGQTIFEFLNAQIFKPLKMEGVSDTIFGSAVSYKVYRDVEFVRCPLDYPLDHVFSITIEDLTKLMMALCHKKLLSSKMWKRILKYDKDGHGMMFGNANGIDCGNSTFMGYGFYVYINQQKKLAFASIANEEQLMKNIEGTWRYFRRDTREIIESAMTFPEKTKMVKLNKSNFWDALNLCVASDQMEFVLEAKSSVAMALMYSTKRAFVQMEGNRVVGLLVLDVDHKKSYYNIDIIIIDKKYQNRGYGKLMLNWAVAYLKKEGAKTLKIGVNRYNHGAKKIYLAAGFTPKSIFEEGMTLQLEF